MHVTKDDIAMMRFQAEMCDNYTQWKCEMEHINKLEAELYRREQELKNTQEKLESKSH